MLQFDEGQNQWERVVQLYKYPTNLLIGIREDSMGNDHKELRKETRKHFHSLWEIAKTRDLDLLSGEEKWMAKVMLEHKDQYFNQFEMADLTYDHEYDVDSEEDPFLHVMLHSAVERQLEAKDP